MSYNRRHNASNPNQGDFERVLCACSAGLLRSPSLAYYLSTLGYNTRACGTSPEYALIPMDDILIHWADKVVFVNNENYKSAKAHFDLEGVEVIVMDIPDQYEFRDPELMKIIEAQWTNLNKDVI